jgi:hypothetical protein
LPSLIIDIYSNREHQACRAFSIAGFAYTEDGRYPGIVRGRQDGGFMNEYHTFENKCPVCGKLLDAATHVLGGEPAEPTTGDISICLYCGTPLIFTEELSVRILTPKEARIVEKEFPQFIVLRESIVNFAKAHKKELQKE